MTDAWPFSGFRFYVGIHHADDGWPLAGLRDVPVCISANTVRGRMGPVFVGADRSNWLLDSGAFTQLALHGRFEQSTADYAALIRDLSRGDAAPGCAVAQDYMCEPHMLARTGGTVADHIAWTVARYDELLAQDTGGTPIMPVLQGWRVEDYLECLDAYGDRLRPAMWVGVGSVCKRQSAPSAVVEILAAIKARRPDLRLHGFGVKLTSLRDEAVRRLLHSADSMAWSYAARREGRNPNAWTEAAAFAQRIAGELPAAA